LPSGKSQDVIRLTPEVYAQLERQLVPLHVDNTTTDLQAGYQLGIQKVLRMVRDGFTIGA
jgi:hypothetical protein